MTCSCSVFRYDTVQKTLQEQVTLAFYHYPPDFLDRYRENIEKVTSADVARVANKYVDPTKLSVLIVGNSSGITPALSTLGTVTPLDVTIDMKDSPMGN